MAKTAGVVSRKVDKNVCPRCRQPYHHGNISHPRAKTRDHILPRAWGAASRIHGDVNNIVHLCSECNGFRARCLDCWAMVACVDAVRQSMGTTRKAVFKLWGLGPVLQAYQGTIGRINSIPISEPDRGSERWYKQKVADAVAIGRIVDRLGVDKFIWPADTPEAIEHNYRVLVGAGYTPPTT